MSEACEQARRHRKQKQRGKLEGGGGVAIRATTQISPQTRSGVTFVVYYFTFIYQKYLCFLFLVLIVTKRVKKFVVLVGVM